MCLIYSGTAVHFYMFHRLDLYLFTSTTAVPRAQRQVGVYCR